VIERKHFLEQLLAAQKEIGCIDKDAKNEFHKYKYASAANVSTQTREVFHSLGLILTSSMLDCTTQLIDTSKTNKQTGEVTVSQSVLATVKINYRLTHTASGEFENYVFYGLGYDANDKAVNKAITAAGKYAVLQILQLATGDDSEGSDPKKKKPTTHRTTPTKTTKPAKDGLILESTIAARMESTHDDGFCTFCKKKHIQTGETIIKLEGDKYWGSEACALEGKAQQQPDTPTTMADDDAPMTEKEITELDKLFAHHYDSAFWEDFKKDMKDYMTFGVFKSFKKKLTDGGNAGIIGEGLDEVLRTLRV
jgi:hypothetical protein